jgi:hypothetical protein
MNYNFVYLIFGMIFGYFLMFVSSNLIVYKGPDSNNIRKKVFQYNGKLYKFIPKIK